ncbi:MAG: C39 family peptidase [Clostridia bacterium]|nr:C39 family peptidase [Clostridia bacterium]
MMKANKSLFRRMLSVLLVVCTLCCFAVNYSASVAADTGWTIVMQNLAKWDNYVYGTGTLRATGCGNFALVNAVGYLTGRDMDVTKVAQWAYDIGGYNDTGANGTNRHEVYPYVNDRWGDEYGFYLDYNGGAGWWSNVNNSTLKNHLANGGAAVAHVPNHFIALVGYDYSTDKFHVLDSYPTTSRGTSPGDVWRTTSQLTGSVYAMTIDWWCLISADNSKVSAPTISAANTLAYNTTYPVSWGAVTNATSYTYKAEVYQGEVGATSATTVASGTVTGTSVTIPAQTSGKYMKVTVTAVGAENSASASVTAMMGPWVSYPTKYEYIPVADVNGSAGVSNSTVWTSSKGTNFGMTWWRAFMCSPNADGTYTVNTIYENGVEKNVAITGNNVLWAIHSGYTNYELSTKIVVGDKLTFVGVYMGTATVRGSGHVLVNGGIPLHPEDLTVKDNSVALDGDYLVGVGNGASGSDIISKFNEDSEYIKVYNTSGAAVTNGVVGTGYTVNLVVDNTDIKTFTIIISGDLNSDGATTTSDVLVASNAIDGSSTLSAAYIKAGDYDKDGILTTTDYMTLCGKL